MNGRVCESSHDQTGESELEKGCFHRKVSGTRNRVQESIVSIGELCWEGLDGTDTDIDGKTSWQISKNSPAVQEKEQYQGRQEEDIYIKI